MASALIVDFHGPIAFRFTNKDGLWAWAYVPICDYHTCNVLTNSKDVSPELHRVFELQGPLPTETGKTQIPKDGSGQMIGAELIQEDWKVVRRTPPMPTEQECYCIFKLPLPDYIVGLRKEPVTIEKTPGSPEKRDYARGHRFCYSKCNVPKIVPSKKPSNLEKLDPKDFETVYGSDVKYQIEIRYHDINPLQPRPHRDADLCSASMRNLFPPFINNWKVTFDNPEDVFDVAGPHGSDCLAHGLVLNDGGIQS